MHPPSKMAYGIGTSLLVALVFIASNALSDEITGTVTEVIDGDTIRVSVGSTKHVVRLPEIDTPERDQPWGRKASRSLADILTGARVTVRTTETDRYGHVMPSLSEGVIESLGHQIRAGWV